MTHNEAMTLIDAEAGESGLHVAARMGEDLDPARIARLVSAIQTVTDSLRGDLRIDREQYLVHRNDEKFVLPRKEFELLSLLASKPGKVFTREEILERVWGSDIVVGDRTIDVHIRKLREKLGEELIKTVKGIGYKYDY